MQSTRIATQRQRRHVGIAALPEHAVSPVCIAQPVKQIGISRVPVCHGFHEADGPVAVSGFLDHGTLGKAGELAEHSAVWNTFQIGQRNLGLSVIG